MSEILFKVIKSDELDDAQVSAMHQLFLEYYNGVSLDQFAQDLKKSTQCIIAINKSTNKIAGFIGQHILGIPYKEKNIVVFCGGKTISDRQYWKGHLTNQLQMLWIKELFAHYLKNISKPHYMYFAPTGFKTYLLLTNNSIEYWPCWNNNDEELSDIANFISVYLYDHDYNSSTKLVNFKQYYALRQDVAEITEEMLKNPKIALFAKLNPTWKQGTGLPSIARINLLTLIKMVYRKFRRSLSKKPRNKINKGGFRAN